jgi:putative FmdB family regulatory protein
MPIYEYSCKACDAKFEQLQRTMSSDAKVKCPTCGSTKTARAMSVFAVGAEGASTKSAAASVPGMCGRCGGLGPCASGY